MRCLIVGRSGQRQDDDGIRRQTALDLSESREPRVEIKVVRKADPIRTFFIGNEDQCLFACCYGKFPVTEPCHPLPS
jgi:hypothetical protein